MLASSDDDRDFLNDDIHSFVCAQPPSNATVTIAIAIRLAKNVILLLRIRCQFPLCLRALLRNGDPEMRA